jgi:arylsulfate sulfotransferase
MNIKKGTHLSPFFFNLVFMNYLRLLYIVLFLTVFSCSDKGDIENVALTHSKNSSIITVTADFSQPGSAVLSIWPKDAPDTVFLTRIEPASQAVFRLSLLPANNYCYQIHYQSELASVNSPVECFKMAAVPAVLPEFEVVKKPTFDFTGRILLKQYGSPAAHYLINSAGEITWYQQVDSMPEKSFRLIEDNEFLTLPTTKEILRLNFQGDTLARFLTGQHMNREVHHDAYMDNKLTVAITYEYKEYDFSEFGGSAVDSVRGDGIVVLNDKGEQLWHWSIFDEHAPEASEKLFKGKIDYGHANAITMDGQGNYLLSFRDFNQIWKIEANSGKVLWKLGDLGDFPLQTGQFFQKQHAIHFNKFNNLVVFDNIAESRTISRILFFDLDEEKMVLNKFDEIKLPKDLYSFKQASAYQVSDTTYLVCSAMKNKLAIIDRQGRPLWEAQSSETFYRAYFVNDVEN